MVYDGWWLTDKDETGHKSHFHFASPSNRTGKAKRNQCLIPWRIGLLAGINKKHKHKVEKLKKASRR